MKILVVGKPVHFNECRLKFPDHDIRRADSHKEASNLISSCEVVFDFVLDRNPEQFQLYAIKPLTVFVNACMVNLASLVGFPAKQAQGAVFGFNGFPTLFNREFLELCVLKKDDTADLESVCATLKTRFLVVDDRIGLVTPRVICMIINEAYYTVQEKTATRGDIDLAMKLGTNYPYGPFEWCEKIGLKHVYELLDALYRDTQDERYKISALMKKEYLALQP